MKFYFSLETSSYLKLKFIPYLFQTFKQTFGQSLRAWFHIQRLSEQGHQRKCQGVLGDIYIQKRAKKCRKGRKIQMHPNP